MPWIFITDQQMIVLQSGKVIKKPKYFEFDFDRVATFDSIVDIPI